MKLLLNVQEINKAIESIANRGKKLDHDIHVAGVSVLKHVAEHGDTTLLDKLVNAMPKGARKGAFCEWALAFGNVRMLDRSNEADKLAIEQGRLFAKDKTKEYNEVEAMAKAWYDFKPEPDLLTTFDAAQAVKSLLKKYKTALDNGAEIKGGDVAMQQLKSFMQTLTTMDEQV